MKAEASAGCLALTALLSVLPSQAEIGPLEAVQNPPTLRFSILSTDDVLAQNSIFSILQDARGFLWLGTEGGLHRYDGQKIQAFERLAGEEEQRYVGLVPDLALSPDGEVWFAGGGSGLCRVDAASGALHCLSGIPDDASGRGSPITTSLAFDHLGRLWAGTRREGLFRLRSDGRSFDSFPPGPGTHCRLGGGHVSALLPRPGGGLWVGTSEGLFLYSEDVDPRGCFSPVQTQADAAAPLRVSAIFEDRQGGLWVGSRWQGVFYRPAGTDTLSPLFLPKSHGGLARAWVSAFAEDEDRIWIGTVGQGLFRLERDSGRLLSYRSSMGSRGALEGDSVRAIFLDRTDQLWIGLEQAGLASLPRERLAFGHIQDLEVRGMSQALRGIFSVHIDEAGVVWAGSLDQGLYGYDPATGRAEVFLDDDGGPGQSPAGRIYALAAGRPGETLVGASNGRLYSLEGLDSRPREVADFQGEEGALIVRALVGAADGSIWVATWQGPLLYLPADRSAWSAQPLGEGPTAAEPGDPLLSLTLDRSGRLWAGTWSSGLLMVDPATGKNARYLSEARSGATPIRVASVLQSARGDYWVATDRGLFRSAAVPFRFSPVEAFGQNLVLALEEDTLGRIWAAGTQGLWCFDPETQTLRQFHHRHGLQSQEFNVGASARGAGGILAFGGLRGLNLFHPGAIPELQAPTVALVEARTSSRPILGPDLPLLAPEPLVLSSKERSLSFSAAVLDFLDPRRNLYSYRLRGFSDVWTEPSLSSSGAFTNLPPGEFVLEVRGASADGAWSPSSASLSLEVEPTLWERPWIRAILAVLGLCTILATAQLWHRRRFAQTLRGHREAMEIRQRLLEEREKERIRLALELHDGPLQTLHAVQLQLSRQLPQRETLQESLGALVQQLRSVCSRLRSPLLQPYGLGPALKDFAERLRERHPEVSIDWDLKPETAALPLRVRQALFRIFQEALSNAIRHGAPERLHIALQPGPPETVLEIKDNGRGFSPPDRWIDMARDGHLGILGMAERAESVGGRFQLTSEPGRGAAVRVTVPSLGKEPDTETLQTKGAS